MKIMFHGYFGYGNIGDEAILTALINEYRKKYPNAEFVILSVNPKRTRKIHGIKAVKEKLTSFAFWKEFLKSDILILGGGGRYGDSTWRRIAIIGLLTKFLGKRIIVRAVGVYPYNWWGSPIIDKKPRSFRGLTRALIVKFVESADYVSVRDVYSLLSLRLSGVRRAIRVEKDPSLMLKVPKLEYCKDIASEYGLTNAKPPIIGINLRTLDETTNKLVIDVFSSVMRRFIDECCGTLVFVPFGFGSFRNRFFDDDLILGKRLKKSLDKLIIIDKEVNPLVMLCIFNYFDVIIAMRYHAILFSIIAGKPTLALIYDTKSEEFLRSVKHNRLHAIRLDALNVNLLSTFLDPYSNK